MNTLAKEIFKPKLFSDQHERFEKEYPGFHQMIYDSMEEYAKAYAPVPGKEEIKYENVIAYLMNAYNQIIKFGDAEKNDFNANVYFSHAGNINTAMETLSTYKEFLQPSTASNEDKAERAAKEYGEWQLCPKCNGDGNLGRYNSPNMSTTAAPLCDVCNGAKILAKPILAGASFKDESKEMDVVAIEKIYDAFANWYHDDGSYDTFLRSEAWKSIQEYITGASFNKDAVEFPFAEWASHSDWTYLPSKKLWYNEEDEENITPKTTQELYNLYLDSIKQIKQ